MRRKLTTLAAAGTLGLAAIAGGAGIALADDAPSATATAGEQAADGAPSLADRVSRIKDALASLVTDGTLTQSQADKVADTLGSSDALGPGGHGPGGPGMGGHGPGGGIALDTAATTLGMSEDDLRSALEDGKTLADVAADQGIEVQTLVDDLVAAAQDRLDQAVADGRMTQEQADTIAADLPDEIAEHVQQGFPQGGPGGPGHHGPGRGGPQGERGGQDGSQDGGSGGSSTEGSTSSSTTGA